MYQPSKSYPGFFTVESAGQPVLESYVCPYATVTVFVPDVPFIVPPFVGSSVTVYVFAVQCAYNVVFVPLYMSPAFPALFVPVLDVYHPSNVYPNLFPGSGNSIWLSV